MVKVQELCGEETIFEEPTVCIDKFFLLAILAQLLCYGVEHNLYIEVMVSLSHTCRGWIDMIHRSSGHK